MQSAGEKTGPQYTMANTYVSVQVRCLSAQRRVIAEGLVKEIMIHPPPMHELDFCPSSLAFMLSAMQNVLVQCC